MDKKTIKKKIMILIPIVTLIVAILLVQYWVRSSVSHPLSEDAVVNADTTSISSVVPGRVIEILVTENSAVQKGDVLFRIDPTPYQLRVDQAQAAVDIAQAALQTKLKHITAEESNSEIVDKEVAKTKLNYEQAAQTLARLTPLYHQGYVTKQQFDDATTLKNDTEMTYQQAINQSVAAKALVNDTLAEENLLKAQQSQLAFAKWELENTVVKAPHSGWIAGLTTAPGQFIISGQSLFTLINTDQWYVSAYFRETELPHIRLGRCAVVYVLADKSKKIKGTVQGIGWGVISTDLINIPSQLPYIPKSLNWVSVEQRFPVRIDLTAPPEFLMRVGASAVVIIQEDDDC